MTGSKEFQSAHYLLVLCGDPKIPGIVGSPPRIRQLDVSDFVLNYHKIIHKYICIYTIRR